MSETIPANQRRIRTGGLMRCCLATVAESEEPSEVGTVLPCKFEGDDPSTMVVAADGIWEWNHP